MQEFHQAELASINARREAQTEDDKFKLEDTRRRSDAYIERMRILNERTPGGLKTTEQSLYDASGKLIGSKKTTTGPTQGMTRMLAKDGVTEVDVPNDKVDDFMTNYGGTRKQ
jgi:hypothetical protein